MSGRLVLVATPIGNLEDLSERAVRTLKEADLWLVEDTRVTGKLQSAIGVKRPMRVLNDHTGPAKIREYVELVRSGSSVALVSDAGSPVVSDPGSELVEACHDAGLYVDGIPGASAVTLALGLSGFYGQRYAFLGFLSRKASQAEETLAPFAGSALTLVMFESPHRLEQTLTSCFKVLGERSYTVCRELTKAHQQVWRSRLPVTPTPEEVPRRGEVTLVVEGHRRRKNLVEPESV